VPMSEGILLELQFFFRAFGWGILMMLLYNVLQVLRKVIRHSVFAVAVEDILYWVVCGVLIFRMLYLENSGAVRGFAIAAVLLGMLAHLQFEKIFHKLRKKLHNFIKSIIIKEK